MQMPGPCRSRASGGFTLIELLVSVAIIALVASLAVPMYADAIRKGRASALQASGKALHGALMRYYNDYGAFPSEDLLDTTTLTPLAGQGYLHSGEAITSRLIDGQLLVYLAPDIGGVDQQFVAVMRDAADRRVIIAVVHTNLVTDDGDWVDGSFVIDDDDLEEAELD